jgi:hypothetical protein
VAFVDVVLDVVVLAWVDVLILVDLVLDVVVLVVAVLDVVVFAWVEMVEEVVDLTNEDPWVRWVH